LQISKYAIHNASVAFSLKKYGESKPDVRTPPKSSVLDNIREIYGSEIAK
jgi:DNA mismatch repair protein MLH1